MCICLYSHFLPCSASLAMESREHVPRAGRRAPLCIFEQRRKGLPLSCVRLNLQQKRNRCKKNKRILITQATFSKYYSGCSLAGAVNIGFPSCRTPAIASCAGPEDRLPCKDRSNSMRVVVVSLTRRQSNLDGLLMSQPLPRLV